MEVITIEVKAFKQIMDKLDALSEYVYSMKCQSENNDDEWVDSKAVCQYLNISGRTLQRLRSNRMISYSLLNGRLYYQIGQVKKMLKERIIKSTEESLEELVQHQKKVRRKE